MGTARSLAFNSAFMIAADMTTKIVGLFLVAYLPMVLGPYDFGIYTWVLGVVLLASVFTDLGTSTALVRYIAVFFPTEKNGIGKDEKAKAGGYFRHLAMLKVALTFAVGASLFVFAAPISRFVFGKPFLEFPLMVSALLIVIYSAYTFLYTFFVAIRRVDYNLAANFAQGAIRIALILYLFTIFSSFYVALIAYAIGLLVSLVIFSYLILQKYPFLLRRGLPVDGGSIRKYMLYTSTVVFAWIVFTETTMMLISALLPIENAGYFSVAMSWSQAAAILVPISVFLPFFSMFSGKTAVQRGAVFGQFFKYFAFLIIPITFGTAYLSGPIVKLLYRGEFAAQIPEIFFLLSFTIALNGISHFLVSFYNGIDRPEIPAKAFFAVAILNFALAYALILFYGSVTGAAVSLLASFCIMCIALAAPLKKVLGIAFPARDLARPIAASLVMFLALEQLPAAASVPQLVIYAAVGAVVYLAVQLAIRGITVKEILFLEKRVLNPEKP